MAGSVASSPRVRAAASFPFRLGPTDSDWKDRPFAGLAAVNNISGAGDALVTVALAGSVFVSVSLSAARGRTALGLLFTVLPFAVVGPFVGPAIDRMKGGRRFIVFAAAIGRLAACLLMLAWIHSLLLFVAAFLSLVCSKTHAVAKAALVPGVVDHPEDLVRANSRLAVGGSVVTSVAACIGGLIYRLLGSKVVLDLDILVFATCAGLSLYLLRNTREPAVAAAGGPAGSPEVVGPIPAAGPVPDAGPTTATGSAPGAALGAESTPSPLVGTVGPTGGPTAGGAYPAAAAATGAPTAAGAYPAAAAATGAYPSDPAAPTVPTPPTVTLPPPSHPAASPTRAGSRRGGLLGRIVARLRPADPPYIPRSLRLASVAMAGMRAAAGFLTALVVFGFRHDKAPLIWYGLVAVASVGGNFGGALLAPRMRFHLSERMLVGGAALLIGGTAIGVSFMTGMHRWPAAIVLAGIVALGASLAKTAFDAIVQRDTRDADRSRLFARFESVFQLAWVAGALIPVLVATPLLAGYILTAAVVLGTSAVFVAGLARHGRAWASEAPGPPVSPPSPPPSPPPVPMEAR